MEANYIIAEGEFREGEGEEEEAEESLEVCLYCDKVLEEHFEFQFFLRL